MDTRETPLPKDPMSRKNAIVIIQPGTESDEAASFANTLLRKYSRYAAAQGWVVENLTSLQDFNHVTFVMKGKGAYGYMKHEEGIHSSQHAHTRSSNRRPPSTAIVTVLPEIDKEIEIKATDVLVQVYRVPSSAGEGARTLIDITHVPTGLTVGYRANESPRKKHQIALCVLKAQLWERERAGRSENMLTQSSQHPFRDHGKLS